LLSFISRYVKKSIDFPIRTNELIAKGNTNMKARFHVKKTCLAIILIMSAALFFSSPVYAILIPLNDVSSNDTPADELIDDSVDIPVTGSTSTAMVANDTIAPKDYLISVIGFNASGVYDNQGYDDDDDNQGDDDDDDNQGDDDDDDDGNISVPDASIMWLLGSSLLGLALLGRRKSKN